LKCCIPIADDAGTSIADAVKILSFVAADDLTTVDVDYVAAVGSNFAIVGAYAAVEAAVDADNTAFDSVRFADLSLS
jgi:hypothetical protein